nr:YqgE/AlgH family protein [Thermoleophilaceae bacterium]
MSGSLRGKLLIAAPQLLDYFRRTVLLVVEHTEEGAMAVVLNRPTENEVAVLVPELAELAGAGEVVHAGGPVNPDSVLALGDFEDPLD